MLYKDRIKKILQSALECGYYKKDSRYIQLSETAVNNILSMLDKLDETEILPCPFCGEVPVGPIYDCNWYIECQHCNFVMVRTNKNDLINIWNYRYKEED